VTIAESAESKAKWNSEANVIGDIKGKFGYVKITRFANRCPVLWVLNINYQKVSDLNFDPQNN